MRKDWKKLGGGFFLIDNQLPSHTVKIENPSDIEILTTEITIRKYKSLVSGIQKPQYLSENNLATIVGNYYK